MPDTRKLLDSSSITKSNSITITKRVIGLLNAKIGDKITFCLLETSNKIILTTGQMKGGEIVLGTKKLSSNKTVVLPEEVREKLHVRTGDQIAYYQEPGGRISLGS